MKADNLHKRERLYKKAFNKALERERNGFFEGAAIAYLEAAKLVSKDKYPETVLGMFNNAGLAYRKAKQYVKAENCLQEGLAIVEDILDINDIDKSATLLNLSSVYLDKHEFDKAERYCSQALLLATSNVENNQDYASLAGYYNNLGKIYAEKDDFVQAGRYYETGKNFIEKSNICYPYIDNLISKNQGELERKIDELQSENLELRAKLHRTDRFVYLSRMATMMAHNINQLISVIRMVTTGALSDINDNLFNPETETKPLLEKIFQQTERLNLILTNFRKFARGDRTILSPVNLNKIIEDIYQLLFTAQYQLDKIELIKEFIENPIAYANEFALQEMLISLLSNAREAVKEKAVKQVIIKTWQENNHVGFAIEDSGDGIAEEQRDKLFTPFLSSKNEGMGLGLYFCREIAKDLNGTIDDYDAPIGGAGFKITLPKGDNANGTTV